ncbi:transcriptional regulator2C Crp/Fnr family [gamma proteobacterium IMCC2047]|nr:transcriptional regulator2C Crp/Fnr family [gamma proteobacterium IMCC2047]
MYRVTPGDMCVLTTSCLFSREPFPAEAVAETDLTVRMMPKSQFDRLVNESAEFRELVFKSFGRRLANLIGTVEKLALESIEQRLAKYLLLQPVNPLAITHQDLALEIGTAREVVSRHLKRFEAEGWIQLGRGYIELLDRQALHYLI